MNHLVFRNLSYGVYVLSALDGQRPTGCTVNSVMQITSSPATIAVSVNHDNYTNSCIQSCGGFSVSILSESCDPSLIGRFGFQSGKDTNKYDGIGCQMAAGFPVLEDCCGYIVCKVIDKMETSTHTVFLGEVVDGDIRGESPAMTYSYYHKVIKGKSPKNAPTYLPEADEATKESNSDKWVCSVCGYVYNGDTPFEELPDTYTCPVCRQPKSKFIKQE